MLSLVKALKLAESLEENRAKTYEKYLKVVDFPAGKKVLRFLAKAENGHLHFLKRQSQRLEKGERVLYSKLHQPEIVLPLRENSLKSYIGSLDSDIGILKVVADFERYDIKFYEYAHSQSKNFESRQLFKNMGKIEKTHLKKINKTIKLAEDSQKAKQNLNF
jgi:rubrerythrin